MNSRKTRYLKLLFRHFRYLRGSLVCKFFVTSMIKFHKYLENYRYLFCGTQFIEEFTKDERLRKSEEVLNRGQNGPQFLYRSTNSKERSISGQKEKWENFF